MSVPLEVVESRIRAAIDDDDLDGRSRRDLIEQSFDLVSVGENGDNDRDVRVHNERTGRSSERPVP